MLSIPKKTSYLLLSSNLTSISENQCLKWIWANYNNSLIWIVRPFGDDSPKINHDFQWGRTVRSWWNLPRWMINLVPPMTSENLGVRVTSNFHPSHFRGLNGSHVVIPRYRRRLHRSKQTNHGGHHWHHEKPSQLWLKPWLMCFKPCHKMSCLPFPSHHHFYGCCKPFKPSKMGWFSNQILLRRL